MSNTLYPIGIQNFEKLRKSGYLYVDKTELIYRLVKRGSYYFLSRPRRFGKSLLISTLEAYFQGKRELFQGLAMEELEREWVQHPIFHLDLNIEKYDSMESLGNILNDNLTRWENVYGREASEVSFPLRFAGVIRRAHEQTGQRVVILVDEYDKPMLQAIHNEELQQEFRNTLKPFYGVLKTMEGIYNPFSVLNTFDKMKFGSYWFETGTPTYLVDLLKRNHYNLEQMAHEETNSDVLNSIYADESPIPVIYQSGYLTIKDYDSRFENYTLGFPNREVEEGFIKFLMPFYTRVNKVESPFEIQQFTQEIESGKPDAFLRRLQSFFADTPYELIRELEVHYQNVLFIVFRLVGFYVKVEYHMSEGRVDLVLQTDRYIYVMEFKLEGTAEEALRQIEEKHYARPFEADSRQLFKIGINFDNKTRNIEKWIVE